MRSRTGRLRVQWARTEAIRFCLLAISTGSPGCSGGGSSPNPSLQYAAHTGQDHGSVNFGFDSPLPDNYFLGAWTHVVPPGSGGKGNDYPFAVYCREGEISFVSGNMGPPAWAYNANIMLFDASGAYINDFTLVFADSSYAADVDWVYVGWHLRRAGSQTSVTQYVKFIGSANLVDNQVTELVPGTWTPTSLMLGSDPNRYADTTMYIAYARIYSMDVPPTAQELSAIYTSAATPDPTAWADWPLINGDPSDVSGHGRKLTVNGAVARGIVGPTL